MVKSLKKYIIYLIYIDTIWVSKYIGIYYLTCRYIYLVYIILHTRTTYRYTPKSETIVFYYILFASYCNIRFCPPSIDYCIFHIYYIICITNISIHMQRVFDNI